MKIYLAGPIFQCEDHECRHWREEAKEKLNGHHVIDPMDRDYRGTTDGNYVQIVEEDKALIDTCDVLLINHLKPSVGTSMEILYAWQKEKRVYAVCHNGTVSPWLLYHCSRIFHSLDEAIDHLKRDNSANSLG